MSVIGAIGLAIAILVVLCASERVNLMKILLNVLLLTVVTTFLAIFYLFTIYVTIFVHVLLGILCVVLWVAQIAFIFTWILRR